MIVSYTRVLFCHYDRNNLMLYIWSRWGQDAVKRMAVRYGIGTSNFWPGETVFWQRDPVIDFASMYMVLHFLPYNMSRKLFHLGHRQFRLFFTKVLQYYYGKADIGADIMDKIRKVALIDCCCAIRYQPSSAPLFLPLLQNHKLRFQIIRVLASLKRQDQ